jgi:uncharacterized protein YdaU (DUF1376 family)
MSFAYLTLYTGDYLRDTRHLTPLKHGVYLLLLMYCWDSRGPAPIDEQECAGIANCRSADEIDALRYVLGKYFVRMDDGFYNPRMQREVERANVISGQRSEAGRRGYEAKAKQLPNKRLTSASNPTTTITTNTNTTTSTTTNTDKVKNNTRSASACIRPENVPEQVWDDFMAIRKAKKSPLTATGLRGIEREATKAHLSLADALAVACERGWQGFKADWVADSKISVKSASDEFQRRVLEQQEKDITP